MGIRGLAVALQGYGSRTSLSGDIVVIDGPALVHRIQEGCSSRLPGGCNFLTRPSYQLIGQMLVAWLDALRYANVNVRKIYFDGYLPPTKWDVRRERLRKQSGRNQQLVLADPVSVSRPPAEDLFANCEPGLSLTKGRQGRFQPKPPFLVPAAMEILKAHEHWGPITQIVPGEADVYCAQDIRENGGTVLTSDSDLLIQNLGSNGAVSFFWDIDTIEKSNGKLLSSVKFSFSEVNRQLGLNETGDISLVAFLKDSGQMNITQACQAVKNDNTGALASAEYFEFLKEHELVDFISAKHPILQLCSDVDPRLSELIIQIFIQRPADATSTTSSGRGPERLSMFLPVMIEDQRQKSCWSVSTLTRQMAYGLLQLCAENPEGSIVEYRSLNPNSPHMGREVNIPGAGEIIEEFVNLERLIRGLREQYSSPDARWFALAVLYDASWSLTEQRQSLSAIVMGELLQAVEETADYSWNFINWCAQIQASYYSLRMLQQVLDVAIHLRCSLPEPISRLRQSLQSFSKIPDWPDENNIASLTKRLGFQGLQKITALLGASEADSKLFSAPEQQRQRKKTKTRASKAKAHKQPVQGKAGLNPFALLDAGCE